MYYCNCGKPVRATYCPDDNVHYPEDNCQDCHDEEKQFEYHVEQAFILQQRQEMKKQLQKLDEQEELPF